MCTFADVIQSISNSCCMFSPICEYVIKSRIKKEVIMEMLTILFAIAAIISVSLVFWGKFTKSGRRWIEGDY
jgi:hypothetical protein